MSYTPMILIDKKSLDEKEKRIIDEIIHNYSYEKNVIEVFNYLIYHLQDEDIVDFDCIKFVLIQPEFTSLNREVRNILSELDINYRVSNY